MTLTDSARRAADADSEAGTGTGTGATTDTGADTGTGATTDTGTGATTDTGAEAGLVSAPAPAPAPAPASVADADDAASRAMGREADGLAVASFVLGLVGLLVFNVLLGPTAIVMALLALARRTRRPGRALLGLSLGVADLAVLAVLVTVDGTVSWSLGG
ncbi:hypothetical protein [Streptomyces sp. NPDC017520]|uniref:hypothetical protein n=1 Tax=Streptomyces sp. NPDC017520 TaxID=3364998 RepID=UPI00378FF29E